MQNTQRIYIYCIKSSYRQYLIWLYLTGNPRTSDNEDLIMFGQKIDDAQRRARNTELALKRAVDFK